MDIDTTDTSYRPQILIVDDSLDNISLLSNVLANDFELRFAVSGREALAIAQRFPPDLILLDVMMPDMDGYETCRQIRSITELASVPVIFVTALSESDAEAQGLALGVSDYITKPINVDIARLRICNQIEREMLRRKLDLCLRSSNLGIWEWHLPSDQVTFDARWAAPLGYKPGQMAPNRMPWAKIVFPEHLNTLLHEAASYLSAQKDMLAVELQMRNCFGQWSWVQMEGKVVERDDDGKPLRMLGTYMNIDARINFEKVLNDERVSMATLLHSMQDTVLTVNTDLVITRCHVGGNPELFAGEDVAEQWIGRRYQEVLPAETTQAIEDVVVAVLGDATPRHIENRILGADGEWMTFSVTVAALSASDNSRVTGLLIVARDISRIMEAEAEVRRLAFIDPLTQLPNRRLLMDRLPQGLRKSARNREHGAVIFLDLDKFKQLNDQHSHERGDQLLVSVASRLRKCVRVSDTVARLGGDEFVVLLECLHAEPDQARDDALIIGNKILQALSDEHQLGDLRYRTTSSVGVTLFFANNKEANEILSCADKAMYAAKQAGGNCLRFFDENGGS